jgi:hypothetical protein
MTTILLIVFLAAFAAEGAGVWLLVTDIVGDRRDLERALADSETAEASEGMQLGGMFLGGMAGAAIAQSIGKQNVLQDFTVLRMQRGYTKRWWALGLVVLGITLGTVGNLLGLAPL